MSSQNLYAEAPITPHDCLGDRVFKVIKLKAKQSDKVKP